MSMSSTMSTRRRAPQQPRGELRLAQLLQAAASLLSEVGYDAATMTGIASRAQASIGTLYQYFPNKPAIVLALRNQYRAEMEERWAILDEKTREMSVKQVAHLLVEIMVRFVEERPAYFPILDAPIKFKRNQEAKIRLRRRIAKVFRSKQPSLSKAFAYRIANVSVQIIKSMFNLYAEANSDEREELVKEYKLVLAAYLEARLAR